MPPDEQRSVQNNSSAFSSRLARKMLSRCVSDLERPGSPARVFFCCMAEVVECLAPPGVKSSGWDDVKAWRKQKQRAGEKAPIARKRGRKTPKVIERGALRAVRVRRYRTPELRGMPELRYRGKKVQCAVRVRSSSVKPQACARVRGLR